jgi:hypothetical protein
LPYRIEQLLVFGRFIHFLTLLPMGSKAENAEFDPNSNDCSCVQSLRCAQCARARTAALMPVRCCALFSSARS